MPLHHRDIVRQQIEDCVFADRDLTRPVPKYRFPRRETPSRDAFQQVSDELMFDGNARQNLATFCQTWEEPEVMALMALSVNKNMIDRDEYPQTAEIERRCVHMMADLWNAPDAANTVGASAIGSSEACLLAGMAAKWRWRAKRHAEGKPTGNPNMVCGPVQVVWHKFARYWDIEMREVPMAHGRYAMDPATMLERVNENTIMVVPTLGVTYTGVYECGAHSWPVETRLAPGAGMMAVMGDHMTLRPVGEDDLPIMEKLTWDPAVAGEFAQFGWFDPRFWRRGWEENGLLGKDGGVLMVVRGDERLGFVNWRRKPSTPAAFHWEIGIAMLPEAQGHGYGTQAHRLLTRYLFTHTTVHRIEAATEVGNVAEQRALEKAGFTREGVLRGIGWRAGAWRDGVMYSLLRTDPTG